jgi:small conductance mechanosensitive channel
MKALDQALQTIIDEVVHWAPKAPVGLLVFFAFWLGSVLVRNIFSRIGHSTETNTRYFLTVVGRTLSLAILLFGGITALGTMGINVSALVAGLGLTGFALGFGLKDILGNLVSGLLILLYRPFSLNEQISVAGMEGCVTEIDLRYTRLENSGKAYLIPNSMMITNTIMLISRGEKGGAGNSTNTVAPMMAAAATSSINSDESVASVNGGVEVTHHTDDPR